MRYFRFTAEEGNGLFDVNKGEVVTLCLEKKLNSSHVRDKFINNSEIRGVLFSGPIEYIKEPTDQIIESVNKHLSNRLNLI